MSDPSNIWYKDGLKFSCTGCGNCCTGSPGFVWVTLDEIKQIADHLNINTSDFSKRYVRQVDDRLSLIEMPTTYDCVFLKNRKCTIYNVRPKQCRTFPWWPQLLESKEDWQEAAQYCEGIQPDAETVPFSTIQKELLIQIGKST
jgi:Fe-S-cluster containining protein